MNRSGGVRQLWFPVTLGIVGLTILVSLGAWQVQRLEWKQGILVTIESRILDTPVFVPNDYSPNEHNYLPVKVEGTIGPEVLLFLTSERLSGPGYRVISPLVFDGRKILVDRGFVAAEQVGDLTNDGIVQITGNLHWPNEKDRWFTPEPDGTLWFAREVPDMARELEAEPLMIVVRTRSKDVASITPMPVTTDGIPNDHLEYAVTWFSLALVWAAMSFFWFFSILRKTGKTIMRR